MPDVRRPCRVGWRLLLAAGLACGAGMPAGVAAAADELRPLVTSFHVHSTVSTGDLTLEQVAQQAEDLGLDAVVLTENFVLRYDYGLPPFRSWLRHRVSLPSVLDYGLDRFLSEVAETQARHPRLLLVPGIEVTPHYYWTGSLLDRNLTMHNSQKNILVVGLSGADDYRALPVNGNPGSYHYDWTSLAGLLPAVLFVPAAWLWTKRSYRTTRVGVTAYREARRHRTAASVLAVLALLLLLNAWPPGEPVFSAYDDRLGYKPYQAFIDAVGARGGVTVWSMPEARDFNVFDYGPLGGVTVKTDPYPEALLMTRGYTAFGGVYQDTRKVTLPGGEWDQVLAQYLARPAAAPPFALGEIAFHGLNRDTRELDQVLTVFQVRERTIAGLVEALRAGRHYAVGQPRRATGLRLDDFRAVADGGARTAGAGESLDPQGSRDVALRLRITTADGGAHPISVTVIRSGEVIARLAGETPFEQAVTDPAAPPAVWHAYRLQADGGGAELLSNPIFVGPVPPPEPAPDGTAPTAATTDGDARS